ncbi:MAG: GNAT family N-acetyltransferase [Bacillota bacterium]
MVFLRKAQAADIQGIVSVHLAAFQGFLMSLLGERFLLEYYDLALNYEDVVAFVSEDNGLITGFIVGFIGPERFYKRMRLNRWRLVKTALRYVIRRPRLWIRVLGSKQRMDRMASTNGSSTKNCELASVAVRPDYSSGGIGKQLMKAFLQEAEKRGVTTVYLITDATKNEAVNAFYRGVGFRVHRSFEAAGSRLMYEYVYEIRQGMIV